MLKNILIGTIVLFTQLAFSQKPTPKKTNQSTTKTIASKPTSKPAPKPKGTITYEIVGNLNGLSNYLVVLNKFKSTQLTLLDSVRTDALGNFKIKNTTTEECIAYLQYNTTTAVPLILEKGCSLVVNINPTGRGVDYTVSGKLANKSISLYKAIKTHSQIYSDLGLIEQSVANEQDINKFQEAQYKYMIKQKELETLYDTCITKHSALEGYFIYHNLVEDKKGSQLKSIKEKMEKNVAHKTNTYYVEIAEAYNANKSTEIGEIAPDIELLTPDGDKLKLSSLRGKYVLIDFWASWCGPCRAEFPYLKNTYNAYKDKGFEIYGVSLDDNAGNWKSSIISSGLTWKHVSDLKKWNSTAARLYKVSGIPFTVLLDKEGKIIAKNLRGQELENKLAELLK